MSVVAWDGMHLAADMQASGQGVKFCTPKMRRSADGIVYAWTGPFASSQPMVEWHARGARSDEYPEQQKSDDRWCRLIVAIPGLGIKSYEQTPAPLEQPTPWAWGSGMEFALGAMAMGASAKEAVVVACRFSTDCGLGVSVCRPGPFEAEDVHEKWDDHGSESPQLDLCARWGGMVFLKSRGDFGCEL